MSNRTVIKQLLLALAFALAVLPVAAQKADTTALLEQTLADARLAKEHIDLTNALANYFTAVNILERRQQKDELSKVYEEMGQIYTSVGLHEKSIEYYSKSAEANPQHVSAVEALGNAYYQLGNFNKAISKYSEALGIRVGMGKPAEIIPVLERMVVCFNKTGQFSQALENEQVILDLYQTLGDSVGIANAYNNIGYAYRFLGEYEQADFHLTRAYIIQSRIGMPKKKAVPILLNLSVVFQNKQDYPRALEYARQAEDIISAQGTAKEQAEVYNLRAQIYLNQGDVYNAEIYNNKALEAAKKAKDIVIQREAYLTASVIYQRQEEFQAALDAYKTHLQIRDSLILQERLRQQELLQQQFAYERAEKELRLVIAQKERLSLEASQQQLLLENQKKEIDALEKQQELQRAQYRQKELEYLSQQQEKELIQRQLEGQRRERQLDSLRQHERLEQIETAKRRAEEKAEVERLQAQHQLSIASAQQKVQEAEAQSRLFTAIGILFTVIIIVLVWSWVLSRNKNRALALQQEVIRERNAELYQINEEMATQRDAVAMANEQLNLAYMQITDSVRYAQRIQQSILVPPSEIISCFSEGFILFKPRDLVSGDFYWFAQHDHKCVITAVDCTGHGVPGAFMSLIGNDLLNDIVNLRGITEPAQILEHLDQGVRMTLKQDITDNQDGMDMALCTIDWRAKKMTFAGAKNPLIYVQRGEVHQIKGDKMPIGGKQLYGDKQYSSTEIALDAPTWIYIFSDGYQDQFGGPENKKFMAKRLRELLFENHQKPMQEQGELLLQTLLAWMGKEKQLDDILVVGLKIDA